MVPVQGVEIELEIVLLKFLVLKLSSVNRNTLTENEYVFILKG